MDRYSFYYDNELLCHYKGKNYNEKDAIDILSELDKYTYKQVYASKLNIRLVNNNTSIKISKDALTPELIENMPNTIKKIRRAVKRYEQQNIIQKRFKNIKLNSRKVIAGTLAFTMLLGSREISLKNNLDNEVTIESEDTLQTKDYKVVKRIKEIKDNNNAINLDIEPLYQSITYMGVLQKYGDLVNDIAPKFGYSSNFVISEICQESGGRYANAMNILSEPWMDFKITTYRHDLDKEVSYVLTDNKENYDSNINCISPNELLDARTNITYGCVLLSYCLKRFNYNIPLAITAYNCGISKTLKLVEETSLNTGLTVEEIINNPSNTDFLNYRYVVDAGDKEYLEHVLRYMDEDNIEIKDNNKNIHTLKVSFENIKTL